jgi:hypothetical protein
MQYLPLPGSGKIMEKISVGKQTRQKFDLERFNLRNLMVLRLRKSTRWKSQIDLQL